MPTYKWCAVSQCSSALTESAEGCGWRGGFKLSGATTLGVASDWTVQPEMRVDYVERLSGNDTLIDLRFLEP